MTFRIVFRKIHIRLAQIILSQTRRKTNNDISHYSKIGVLIQLSRKSKKFNLWHDGFTAALEILSTEFDQVEFIYFDSQNPLQNIESINQYDFIIVKSAWRTPMDLFLRKYNNEILPDIGLMISSSLPCPRWYRQDFYQVVWYETKWYFHKSLRHSNAHHGFGIDTSIMRPTDNEKLYDWICIGAPRKYKRIERLIKKSGKKLFIGDLTNTDKYSQELLSLLKKHQVEIRDFSSYKELAGLYNQSKKCYIPCELHGGGERALLEARACGREVGIESDNPKLAELLRTEIWNQQYYAHQLMAGLNSMGKSK